MLAELPPIDRSILYLIDVEGISATDVATMLNMRASTVRGRASRSRRRLRKLLHGGGER
ncbi:MAG: sigma-70 region 4 domain-containing protein [Actinobacteria bacterium]|nr:sigma-70 region 4 domain-containing protein [Actinomycetota bacterium]